MKNFVVGHLSLFDNVLVQEIVIAKSALEAAIVTMLRHEYVDTDEEFTDLEQMQLRMFDRDINLGVIEI